MFMLGPTGWMTASKARIAEAQAYTENQRLAASSSQPRTRRLPHLAGGALNWIGVRLVGLGLRLETVPALPLASGEDHEQAPC